ncbi:MAG: protein phosphatase 2C domain-containing protein [Blastocatellia bacterium]
MRGGNEDNFLILDLSTGRSWTASEAEPQELLTYSQGYYGSLLAVSDGMGGALAGEVASRMAVETVRDRMLQLQAHEVYGKMPFAERLRLSIEEANLLINGESQTNPAHKGLGATFTAIASQGGQVYFGQVGDSRAHLIRQGRIYRITKDQSLVQQLIDAGQITEEEAETHSYRNVILQALGAHGSVNVEVTALKLCQMDTLVLCSDGLSGKMHQGEIAKIVNEASDFKSACQQLIDLANDRGGEDNITVVIAQFSGPALSQPATDDIDPQNMARSPDTPTEINWGMGATTDPLDAAPSSSQAPRPEIKPTEPLPAPPSQSTPFTAKISRKPSAEHGRTNDMSDRREPITAVFAPEDFEEAPAAAPRSSTGPLNQRPTEPLASPAQGEEKPQKETSDKDGSSKGHLLILLLLLSLGIGGIVIGATSYFRQKAEARSAEEQAQLKMRIEFQKQKDGQIGRLREKIAEINRRLQTTDKGAIRERRELWNERLTKLSLKLDEIGQWSSEQFQEISQICDEINKELKKIEDDVNSLQGLLPSATSDRNRDPIKI